MNRPWTVYILRCADGSLYTGIAADLERRLSKHRAGKGSRCVASRLPFELVYKEKAAGRSEALKREMAIKKLTKAGKEALLSGIGAVR